MIDQALNGKEQKVNRKTFIVMKVTAKDGLQLQGAFSSAFFNLIHEGGLS